MPRVNRETFQNSNVPTPLKLPKGKIEKIEFPEELEEQVYRIWRGQPPLELIQRWKEQGKNENDQLKYYNPGTKLARINRIKVLIGYSSNLAGYCRTCGDLNTHLVKYRTQGITIVERYCSEHVPDKI